MAIISIYRLLISFLILYDTETSYELFSIGCQLELNDRIDSAIVYYEKALTLSPKSTMLYSALANALYKARKFNQGIKVCKDGLIIAPHSDQLYAKLAIGYIGKGDLINAINTYETMRQNNSGDIELYNTLSVLYEASGNVEKANKLLLEMPDSLKNSNTFVRLGALAGKTNDHPRALDYYRQAYQLDTTNITALIGIGTGFDLLNVKDSAIYYYRKSLVNDSLLPTVGKRLVELYDDTEQYGELIKIAKKILSLQFNNGYIRRNLGFALYKLGELESAFEQFLLASRLEPNDVYSKFYIGRIMLEQQKYDRARQELQEAIKLNPDFIELWVYLGFIALDLNDYESAEYAFAEAAHRGGDLTQLYYLLGVTAEMKKDYCAAYYHYHKALTTAPQDITTLEALANLCVRLNKEQEALKTFERIIKIDSTNAVALNYVGYSYAEKRDSLPYALDLINKALLIEANNGYYLDSRGWIFYQMGKFEKALKDLQRAAQLVKDVVIFEHLGDVYMKLNRLNQAEEAYKKALELDPINTKIQQKLKYISK